MKSVNFCLYESESVALVGPSGSGKSSLLMLLGGLEHCTGGSINVLGSEITDLPEDDLAKLRKETISIVFQSFHLIPTMSALENVSLPLELSGKRNPTERAHQLLEDVGLLNRKHHYPAQLSGGEQQRVAIARALSTNPKIILADEPTGNLDQKTGDIIVDLLFDLGKKNGSSLIIVTHSTALAARCDRSIELFDGSILN